MPSLSLFIIIFIVIFFFFFFVVVVVVVVVLFFFEKRNTNAKFVILRILAVEDFKEGNRNHLRARDANAASGPLVDDALFKKDKGKEKQEEQEEQEQTKMMNA